MFIEVMVMGLGLQIEEVVEIPDGVVVGLKECKVAVQGPNGKLTRTLEQYGITMTLEGKNLKLIAKNPTKREKSIVGTFASHIRNMIKGVTEGFEYRMKIVYSHFPMRANVKEDTVVIENFLGERYPRFASIMGETKVTVKGDVIILNGPNKEHVGQTAANIEKATWIKGYDPRVFQDGIYITSKGKGEDVA
jgi:large subunit ribosomal protein L6